MFTETCHPIMSLILWPQTQFLEGHSSAAFSSNQLQITPAWKFLVILKTLIIWIRCVWLGLEQNCAELWPSRNWVWVQCFKWITQHNLLRFVLINYSFFSTADTHFQNFTHKSKNCTHKMQNASHLLQNEALHSKYLKHISKANICNHLCHNINSC